MSMSKSRADQTIHYPRKKPGRNPEINLETEVELKYNGGTSRGLWHIFTETHHRSLCLCGGKKHGHFSPNHMHKKRTVQDILENPESGFGRISKPGLTQLQKQVQHQ